MKKKDFEEKNNISYRKYAPFECHSSWHNVYYDSDLERIRRLSNDLQNVLNEMTLRFDRHDTLQIAKSVFDYVTQREMYNFYPHMYYDFRFGDSRICIGLSRANNEAHYFVKNVGCVLDSRFNEYISSFGYGDFDDIESAKTLFSEIVRDFILAHLGELF